MRSREKVLHSLESVYRAAFTAAEDREDRDAMARLDLEYQRDQLQLEVLMDIRDLLDRSSEVGKEGGKEPSLLERAQNLRRLTKLR
jgi:hypothetical protein